MHEVAATHSFLIAAIIFASTFVIYLLNVHLEEALEPSNFFEWIFFQVVGCLSKLCSIGLGIAVGIEFFMLAHGG